MPEEFRADASAANAVSKKSVWEMQSTRSLVAYAEWAHSATFGPFSETLVSSVELSGQVIGRCQRNASGVLIPFGEMVMPSEKPNECGITWNHVSVVLGLKDRSHGDAKTDCDGTVCRKQRP